MKKCLNELKIGDNATVVSIETEGELKRKLLDMGIIKGSKIEVLRVAPLGDPIDIKIRGYQLSLRKAEASGIIVEVNKT